MDIYSILRTLPHRYPFLLVDKIIELEEGKRAVGIKNVTINEPFFQGHFPMKPIMPGVLILEAMAQVGAVVALKMPDNDGKLVYFAGIDSVRFRKPVVPGDQLRIEVEAVRMKGSIGKLSCTAKVEGDVVAEGEILFSISDRLVDEPRIHPTATVHPSAELGRNVDIGPYTVIRKWTTLGTDNIIHNNVSIGMPPQDYKYKGEKNMIVIGNKNMIREFATIHLPAGEGTTTQIGNENFIMVYAHIPHNCKVGNQVVIGGYVGLGGYTTIEDQVVIGGLAGIHQGVRMGRLAMIGSSSKVTQDIPPFMLFDGNPGYIRGLNLIGLQRRGVTEEAISDIKKCFKVLYMQKSSTKAAIDEIRRKVSSGTEVEQLLTFLEAESPRGISKKRDSSEAMMEEEQIDKELIFPDIPEIGI